MRLRFILPALLIGAGLWLPVQPAAQAKTSYKYKKPKKYKVRKYKAHKYKANKKFKAAKVRHTSVRHQ
ncbi:MAG TPA: hypothetical protein VMU80_04805 [Bryobacteraceae bacterium]|nr:hypothetical protein [Bryobacteraceae bacterium]